MQYLFSQLVQNLGYYLTFLHNSHVYLWLELFTCTNLEPQEHKMLTLATIDRGLD